MTQSTAALARSITRRSSKLSFLIASLLVDKDLTDDCLRAYAYFRWADDVIDVAARSPIERVSFIERQKRIVDCLYRGETQEHLAPEEEMVADLIRHDRGVNSGLQSFIRNFLDVIEFDAKRKGKTISQEELKWYSECLGRAVTDAIQYFIGNDQSYPAAENQYLAATAAHITHMLRDFCDDLNEGFFNVPEEYLASFKTDIVTHRFGPEELNSPEFKAWVRGRVELARGYFNEGKTYLDQLDNLRCKIAGYWYCARFEFVLDAIERDQFLLRPAYTERSKTSFLLNTGTDSLSIIVGHLIGKTRRWLVPKIRSQERRWHPKAQHLDHENRPLFN